MSVTDNGIHNRDIDPGTKPRSVPVTELFDRLRGQTAQTFQQTTALFKSELKANAEEGMKELIFAGISVASLTVGMLFTLAALDLLLITILSPEIMDVFTAAWVCTSGIALVCTSAGVILIRRAKKKISGDKFVPTRTLEALEKHGSWIKSQTEDILR